MAIKTESKMIGEHEYSVTQWSVELAMLNKFKLLKAFGPSIAKLAVLETNKGNEVEALSDGLTSLFQNNDPKELVTLMKSCIVGVAKDGKRITENRFTEMFDANDLMEIYQIFIFVLQVNYANFLKGQWTENLLAKMEQQ